MIKTIKVKKQFRLDELLKYVWDNDLNRIETVSSSGRFKLKFIDNKSILVNSESTLGPFGSTVSLSTTEWEIEVEEEVTDDMVFKSALVVHHGEELELYENLSIKGFKHRWPNSLQMHAVINGKLQLIWETE